MDVPVTEPAATPVPSQPAMEAPTPPAPPIPAQPAMPRRRPGEIGRAHV